MNFDEEFAEEYGEIPTGTGAAEKLGFDEEFAKEYGEVPSPADISEEFAREYGEVPPASELNGEKTAGADGMHFAMDAQTLPLAETKKGEYAEKGNMGGIAKAALQAQRESGIDAADDDGSVGSWLENLWQGVAYNSSGKVSARNTEMNNQDILRGTVRKGGVEVPLTELPDDELDYLADAAGWNGAGGWLKRFFGGRSKDGIMQQWDKTEGKKFANEAERKAARVKYAQDIARMSAEQLEQSREAAGEELEGRDTQWQAGLTGGFITNGAYMLPYMVPGAHGILAGIIEGLDRYQELSTDKMARGEDGELKVVAERDTQGKALAKGAARGVIAPAIEMVGGELAAKGLGFVAKQTLGRVPLVRMLGEKAVESGAGKALSHWIKMMGKFGKATGINSMPVEMIEELEDQISDAALGLNQRDSEFKGDMGERAADATRQFFRRESMKDLVESMLIVQVLGGGAAYAQEKKANRVLDRILQEETGVGADKLKGMTYEQKLGAFEKWAGRLDEKQLREKLGRGADAANELAEAMSSENGRFDQASLQDFKVEPKTFQLPTVETPEGRTTIDFKDMTTVNPETGEVHQARKVVDAESGVEIIEHGIGDELPFTVRDAKTGETEDFYNLAAAKRFADRLIQKQQLYQETDKRKLEVISNALQNYGQGKFMVARTMEEALKESKALGMDVEAAEGYNSARKGWRLPDGTVVLVRDNIHTPREVERLLRHEAVGHSEEMMQQPWLDAGGEIGKLRKANLKKVERAKGAELSDAEKERVLRESVANVVQKRAHDPSMGEKTSHAIREALRGMGLKLKMNDADLEVEAAKIEQAMREGEGAEVDFRPILQNATESYETPKAAEAQEAPENAPAGAPAAAEGKTTPEAPQAQEAAPKAEIEQPTQEAKDETGNRADEAPAKSVEGREGLQAAGEAAKPAEAAAPAREAADAGVVKPREQAREHRTEETVGEELAEAPVLSGDEVRKEMPGYDPKDWSTHVDRTNSFVGPRMEARFQELLKTRKGKGNGEVVFLAGGNGAGKSTVAGAEASKADFVIDSTLGNLKVAKKQMDAILENGQKPVVVFVYRTPEQALEGIKNRVKKGGHIVSPVSFADSHTKSIRNLRLTADEFSDKISIKILDNSVDGAPEITLEQLEAKGIPDYEELRKRANEYLEPIRRGGLGNQVGARSAQESSGGSPARKDATRSAGIKRAEQVAAERGEEEPGEVVVSKNATTTTEAEKSAKPKPREVAYGNGQKGTLREMVESGMARLYPDKGLTVFDKGTPHVVTIGMEQFTPTKNELPALIEAQKKYDVEHPDEVPPSQRKAKEPSVKLKDAAAEKEAKDILDSLDFDTPELGVTPTKGVKVDFASPEFDNEKFGKLVAGVGKLVDVLVQNGHKDFKALATFIRERDAAKFERAKPVLQDIWNAVARSRGLKRVSDTEADEVLGVENKTSQKTAEGVETSAKKEYNIGKEAKNEQLRESGTANDGNDTGVQRVRPRDAGGSRPQRGFGDVAPSTGESGAAEPVRDVQRDGVPEEERVSGEPLERPEVRNGVPKLHEGGDGGGQAAGAEDKSRGSGGRSAPGGESGVRVEPGQSGELDGGEQGRVEASSPEEAAHKASPETPSNYVITKEDEDWLENSKPSEKVKNNIDVLNLLNTLAEEDRAPTPEEKTKLARYVGFGGFPQMFDEAYERTFEKYGDKPAADLPVQTQAALRKTRFGLKGYDYYREIRNLLSQGEIDSMKQAMIDAFFTPINMCRLAHKAFKAAGFNGGRMLETSAGTGNFIGTAEYDNPATWTAIEKDKTTGKILQHLYPLANVKIQGFEETPIPPNFMDAIISNVPFGTTKLHDPEYNKHGFSIHDYFIARSIDRLHVGGVAAFLTSHYTLDKADKALVRYLEEHGGKIVGSVRLPNGHQEKNAGTAVSADIIFIQKVPGRADNSQYAKNGKAAGIPINAYYEANPDMVFGTPRKGRSMYGEGEELKIDATRDMSELDGVVMKAAEGLKYVPSEQAQSEDPITLDADKYGIRKGNITIKDGKVYRREGDMLIPVRDEIEKIRWTKKHSSNGYTVMGAIEDMIKLRDAYHAYINAQKNGTEDDVKRKRALLNTQYDVMQARYGSFNGTPAMAKIFNLDDADGVALQQLEAFDEVIVGQTETGKPKKEKQNFRKSDTLRKRTLFGGTKAEKADSVLDGLRISLNESGRVNVPRIAELTGKTDADVRKELAESGMVFQNPSTGGLETRDEYLSGAVRRKLREARAAAEVDISFQRNVEALEKVQPQDKPATSIKFQIGQSYIPNEMYRGFLAEKVFGCAVEDVIVGFDAKRDTWLIDTKSMPNREWVERSPIQLKELLTKIFNGSPLTVKDRVDDGEGKYHYVINAEKTQQAEQLRDELTAELSKWLVSTPERAKAIERAYNDKMNDNVERKWDPELITLDGISDVWKDRANTPGYEHQKRTIARGVLGGNLCIAHCVGAGKSFEMFSICMQLRRLGLARKPVMTVPNHMVESGQIYREFKEAYPGARIIVATKNDLESKNRRRFLAKVANGDWDCVVMAHSSFSLIGMDPKVQAEYIAQEIADLRELMNAEAAAGGKKRNVKRIEKKIRSKEEKMKKLLDASKKDSTVPFENLGVDYILVDEAHNFKGLDITTRMSNVSGVTGAVSQRAQDMEMKARYLAKLHGGDRGIIFASGTIISNSISEMYTVMRFLAPEKMREMGIYRFDDWAKVFGVVETKPMPRASGKGYQEKTRFAKFQNLIEMKKFFHSFADVVLDEDLNIPRPYMIGGKPIVHRIKADPVQVAKVEELDKRLDSFKGKYNPKIDNPLKVVGEGRLVAIDPALLGLPSEHRRLNAAADEMYRIWQKSTGKPVSKDGVTEIDGTQLVFCDSGVPKEKKFKEVVRTPGGGYATRFGNFWAFTVSGVDANGYRHASAVRSDGATFNVKPFIDHGKDGAEDISTVYAAFEEMAQAADEYNKAKKVDAEGLGLKKYQESVLGRKLDSKLPRAEKPQGEPFDINAWIDENAEAVGYDIRLENPFANERNEAPDDFDFDEADETEEREIPEDADEDTEEEDGGDADAKANESILNMLRGKFNVYAYLKKLLIQRGIPADEIAFIHDAANPDQKRALFADFNGMATNYRGGKRVLIGNTPKMGEGANVQKRLVAIHHLDVPWKPAWLVQRDGRGIRAGNLNDEIGIHRYVTEGTFDVYSYDKVSTKQQFINQAMNHDMTKDEVEDVDDAVLSAEEAKAAAAGPMGKFMLERVHLQEDIRKAELTLSNQRADVANANWQVDSLQKHLEADVKAVDDAKKKIADYHAVKGDQPFGIEVTADTKGEYAGKTLTDSDDIAKYFAKKVNEFVWARKEDGIVGHLFGMPVWFSEVRRNGVRYASINIPSLNYDARSSVDIVNNIAVITKGTVSVLKAAVTKSTGQGVIDELDRTIAYDRKQLEMAIATVKKLKVDETLPTKIDDMYLRLAEVNNILGAKDEMVARNANRIMNERIEGEREKIAAAVATAQPPTAEQVYDESIVDFDTPELYTGSAADYDKPSLVKVGTGEGSQVYGWGLYGSTKKSVAMDYATADANRKRGRRQYLVADVSFDGKPARDNEKLFNEHLGLISNLEDWGSVDTVLRNYEFYDSRGKLREYEKEDYEFLKKNLSRFELKENKPNPEYLYEQTFFTDRKPGDESHLLKWYEPVSKEQLGWVRNAAEKEGVLDDRFKKFLDVAERRINGEVGDKANGESLYLHAKWALGSPQAASEFLARAGIDGVKYPVDSYGKPIKDGDKAGWNYVSFRDDNIRVDHKWVDGKLLFDTPELSPAEAEYAASEDKTPTEQVMREVYGMTNEEIATALKAAEMEPPRHTVKPDETTWQQAEALLSNPSYMAKLAHAVAKFPRPTRDYENLALNVLFRRRQDVVNAAQAKATAVKEALDGFEAVPKTERDAAYEVQRAQTAENMRQANAELAQAKALMFEAGKAAMMGASEQGRALRSNRGLLDQHDYSYAGISGQIAKALGGTDKITPEMEAKIREIAADFAKLDEKGRDFATVRLKAFAEKVFKQLQNGEKMRKLGEIRTGNEAKRVTRGYMEAMAQIEVGAAETGGTLIGLTDQQYPAWGRWLKAIGEYHCYIDPEITEARLMEAIVEDISPFMDGVDANQVRDALTGFGHNFRQSRYEAQRLLNDLRSQARLKRQLDWMNETNAMPPLTGLIRDEPSQTTRELQKEVQARKAEVPDAGRDERRLKSALDAAKKRIENRIADLERAIATGEQIPAAKRSVVEDIELREKRKRKDELQKEYDAMFKTARGMTDAQRLAATEKALARALEQAMEDLARAQAGDFSKRAKRPAMKSPTIDVLREKVKDVRENILELKAAKYEFGMTPEEIAAYNARKMKNREKVIARLAKRVATGDLRPQKKAQPPMDKQQQADYDEMGRQMKKAHQRLADMRLEAENATSPSFVRKNLEYVKFVTTAQRALRATMDFSAVLRQAARITLGHPVMGAKAFGKAWEAAKSDLNLTAVNDEIMADPTVREGVEKYGLHLREVDAENARDVEMFHGMERNRVKIFGKEFGITDIPYIGEFMLKSERHYITYLNAASAELYSAIVNDKSRFPAGPTAWQKKMIADMINIWNGSAALSKETRYAMQKAWYNYIFWAPGLAISRIQSAVQYDVWHPLTAKGIQNGSGSFDTVSGEERRTMAKVALAEKIKSTLAMVAIGALFKWLLWDDDDDYAFKEADIFEKFMMLTSPKARNTTIDLTGGEASAMRTAHKIYKLTTAGKVKTNSGRTVKMGDFNGPSIMGTIGRFVQGKLAPWASEVIAILEGKDYVGAEYTPGKAIMNAVVPLTFEDIKDQIEQNGIGLSLLTAPLSLLGAGGSTYDRKPYENAVNRFLDAKKEYDAIERDELLDGQEREELLNNIRQDNPLMRDAVREDIAGRLAVVRRLENLAKKMERNGAPADESLAAEIEANRAKVLQLIRESR